MGLPVVTYIQFPIFREARYAHVRMNNAPRYSLIIAFCIIDTAAVSRTKIRAIRTRWKLILLETRNFYLYCRLGTTVNSDKRFSSPKDGAFSSRGRRNFASRIHGESRFTARNDIPQCACFRPINGLIRAIYDSPAIFSTVVKQPAIICRAVTRAEIVASRRRPPLFRAQEEPATQYFRDDNFDAAACALIREMSSNANKSNHRATVDTRRE